MYGTHQKNNNGLATLNKKHCFHCCSLTLPSSRVDASAYVAWLQNARYIHEHFSKEQTQIQYAHCSFNDIGVGGSSYRSLAACRTSDGRSATPVEIARACCLSISRAHTNVSPFRYSTADRIGFPLVPAMSLCFTTDVSVSAQLLVCASARVCIVYPFNMCLFYCVFV